MCRQCVLMTSQLIASRPLIQYKKKNFTYYVISGNRNVAVTCKFHYCRMPSICSPCICQISISLWTIHLKFMRSRDSNRVPAKNSFDLSKCVYVCQMSPIYKMEMTEKERDFTNRKLPTANKVAIIFIKTKVCR